jgi:DNA-binding MarR family transcriptional regulator
MDAVFFAVKRAHYATWKFGRRVLLQVGMTPARFDVLYALRGSRWMPVRQAELRVTLGVARATISEMLGVLEKLGLVLRNCCEDDTRTNWVRLTKRGERMLDRAYKRCVGNGDTTIAVDCALAEGDPARATFPLRASIDELCGSLRRWFGGGTALGLYPWRPDDYLDQLRRI